jgi:hypothetical protein
VRFKNLKQFLKETIDIACLPLPDLLYTTSHILSWTISSSRKGTMLTTLYILHNPQVGLCMQCLINAYL